MHNSLIQHKWLRIAEGQIFEKERLGSHTGQIILMAEMFAEVDLGFYDFTDTKAVPRWKSAP
jgi:hypothetical protein